ncbi:DNA topoisomerase III, partial [Aeromonas diversa CDC 2478-85]
DMTALWEQALGRIGERQESYQHFMGPLEAQLRRLIDDARHSDGAGFRALPKDDAPKRRFTKRKGTKKPAKAVAA